MKVMILSDSHIMSKIDLQKLLKSNKADYYIHCGDIYKSYDNISMFNFYLVKGNNDYNYKITNDLLINIDQQNFFITHGHLYNVSSNLDFLISTAKKKGANIVCFGHTHQPLFIVKDDIIIINPGSVYLPRGNYPFPTYCIFNTENKNITFYNALTLKPCNPFKK